MSGGFPARQTKEKHKAGEGERGGWGQSENEAELSYRGVTWRVAAWRGETRRCGSGGMKTTSRPSSPPGSGPGLGSL